MNGLVEYWNTDPISFAIIGVILAAVLAIVIANLRTPRHIYRAFDKLVDRMATLLNMVAAAWIMMMAWMILVDVIALGINMPIQGTRELISDSVIVILFAQIPLAIRHGGMIRTTIVYDNVKQPMKNVIDAVSFILGIIFFTAIVFGGWENMIIGFTRQEFENVGKFTIPLWPFRYVVTWFSVLAATVYLLELVNIFVKTPEERAAEQDAAVSH